MRTVARLCLAAVAVGVTALIVVNSVMNGLNDSIRERLLAVEPHLVVEATKAAPSFWAGEDWVVELERQPGFEVRRFETQDVIIRTNDGLVGGAVANGVEADVLDRLIRQSQGLASAGDGSLPEPEELALGPGEAIMGADLARGLAIYEGDTITLISPESLLAGASEIPRFERLTVKRLVATNLPEIDGKMLHYRRGLAMASLKTGLSRRTGLEIRTPRPFLVADMKAGLNAKIGDRATVSTWIERNSSLFYALKIEKLAVGMLLALSTLIASFSISTVLTMLLVQKRRDLGVLMALGLSPRKASVAFFQLGLILSGLGVLVGLVLGLLIAVSIDRFQIPLLPDVYYQRTIPSRLDPVVIAVLVAICGLTAVVSSWWPARAATLGHSASDILRSQRQSRGELR